MPARPPSNECVPRPETRLGARGVSALALASALIAAACASQAGSGRYSSSDADTITRADFVATVDCASLPEGVSCDCVIDTATELAPLVSGYQIMDLERPRARMPGAQRDSRLAIASRQAQQTCASRQNGATDAQP